MFSPGATMKWFFHSRLGSLQLAAPLYMKHVSPGRFEKELIVPLSATLPTRMSLAMAASADCWLTAIDSLSRLVPSFPAAFTNSSLRVGSAIVLTSSLLKHSASWVQPKLMLAIDAPLV